MVAARKLLEWAIGEGIDMDRVQEIVTSWCAMLGIVDPASVQIANGIVGAASLLFVVFIVLTMAFGLIVGVFRIGWPPRERAG